MSKRQFDNGEITVLEQAFNSRVKDAQFFPETLPGLCAAVAGIGARIEAELVYNQNRHFNLAQFVTNCGLTLKRERTGAITVVPLEG